MQAAGPTGPFPSLPFGPLTCAGKFEDAFAAVLEFAKVHDRLPTSSSFGTHEPVSGKGEGS